jgi:uncharacterized membrane protein (UPF0127 family)
VSRPHFLQPLLRKNAGRPALRNMRSDRLIASTVETAFESADRRRGLLGRDGLEVGQALVIAPTNLVHTFTMRFAIDIIFASREGRVLKVRRGVRPRRIAGAFGAFAVVELASGQIDASDTRVGDAIQIVYD